MFIYIKMKQFQKSDIKLFFTKIRNFILLIKRQIRKQFYLQMKATKTTYQISNGKLQLDADSNGKLQ